MENFARRLQLSGPGRMQVLFAWALLLVALVLDMLQWLGPVKFLLVTLSPIFYLFGVVNILTYQYKLGPQTFCKNVIVPQTLICVFVMIFLRLSRSVDLSPQLFWLYAYAACLDWHAIIRKLADSKEFVAYDEPLPELPADSPIEAAVVDAPSSAPPTIN